MFESFNHLTYLQLRLQPRDCPHAVPQLLQQDLLLLVEPKPVRYAPVGHIHGLKWWINLVEKLIDYVD